MFAKGRDHRLYVIQLHHQEGIMAQGRRANYSLVSTSTREEIRRDALVLARGCDHQLLIIAGYSTAS